MTDRPRRSARCARRATAALGQGRAPRESHRCRSRRSASCSRASSATRRPSSRRSRTRSSPARTSSSSASAARRRRGSPARLIELLDERGPGDRGLRDQRRPVRSRSAPRAATASPNDGDDVDDRVAHAATGATARSSRRRTSPIADLIGEVDPIKVAEGRYLSDELTIHYGLVPRTQPRHLRDQRASRPRRAHPGRPAQRHGRARRADPRLQGAAAARPVRRRLARTRRTTPTAGASSRRSRTASARRSARTTRRTIEHEIGIMEQERHDVRRRGHRRRSCPAYMKEIVAEITQLARRARRDLAALGRSVRVSIANYENLVSSALKRAHAHRRDAASSPRISDLPAVVASTAGKIELESVGDVAEERVIERLVQRAVLNVFNRTFSLGEFDSLLAAFERGATMHVSSTLAQRRIREAGAADPGHEGRGREARRCGKPGRSRRCGRVRP